MKLTYNQFADEFQADCMGHCSPDDIDEAWIQYNVDHRLNELHRELHEVKALRAEAEAHSQNRNADNWRANYMQSCRLAHRQMEIERCILETIDMKKPISIWERS